MNMQNTRNILVGSTAIAMPRAIQRVINKGDPAEILASLQKDFADFKLANDEKLNGKADVITDEKVERINASVGELQAALDEQAKEIAAFRLNGPANGDKNRVPDPEYSKTFAGFMREGTDEAAIKAAQKTGVYAAMTVGTQGEGGYFAPVEWDRTVTGKLKERSPIRENAKVQTISGPGFRKMYSDRAVGSGWVGETASRPATTTPTITPLDFTPGELYAFPFASQILLEDSEVDIEQWLADEVEVEFSRQENIAFLAGDGVNKPFGLLTYIAGAANDAKHPWGAIGVVNSGDAAALTSDGIIDLFYSVPKELRAGAKLYANRLTQGKMRKLKDGDGNYLWQPSFSAGQPQTLLAYPVTEMAAMPNVAAGAVPIAFGDFRRGYLIVDRTGVRVLRDPYTNKPFVHFYTTKRVGGGLLDPQALRAMRMAAA